VQLYLSKKSLKTTKFDNAKDADNADDGDDGDDAKHSLQHWTNSKKGYISFYTTSATPMSYTPRLRAIQTQHPNPKAVSFFSTPLFTKY
jgi:hypothetical protein